MSDFYKDWNKSLSINDAGDVPFSRLVDMTPAEKEQACQNLGIASNDQINRLEGEFTQLRGDMNVVKGEVDTALTAVNDAVVSANDAVTAANAALSQVSTVTADVATISGKADTNSGNITTLSSDVSSMGADIASISSKNTIQDNKIGELSSSVAGLTNSAVYHEATINNLTTAWTAYSADLRNDFDTFSATEDAVITAATAAIPGQVSAEVSGQLSGKQDKLTPGINISLTTAGVIDLKNNDCSANSNSVVIGDKSKSTNNYGFVHGRYATNAGQFNAMVAAFNETASGTYNLVAGNQNVVAGNWNTVVGSGNKVTANNFNFANGVANSIGNVEGAHAEGNGTSALGSYTHTEGRYSIAQGTYSHADGDRVSAIGYASHAMGKESYAGGQYSFAIGNYARASGDESFANGTLTRAIGADTHAEGVGTSADGRGAHSEGHNTLTDASYAHAEGEATRALNNGAHSEGSGTSAIGVYSHTEGEGTRASRLAHAEGRMTYASNDYSHTEGNETFANGVYAHAEGYASSAISNRSHAEGQYTITDTVGQHVEGKYNAPATGALHVIGNGSATTARSNIVETYTDRVVVNGDLIASEYNLNKAAEAMNDFIFDTVTPTGYQTVLKLNTNDWQIYNTAYSAYTKKYDRVFVGDIRNPIVGNTQMCGIKNLTAGPVGIVDWKGDISRACWGSTTAYNRNNVSSWPSTIPIDVPNVTRLFSENNYLTSVDQIPTNFIEATSGKYKTRCFQRCLNLRGDVTPYIAAFSAESSVYTEHMFGGCTGVDNFATLSAQYPNFFSNPS